MKANVAKIKIIMANGCIEVRELQRKAEMPRPTLNNVLSGCSVRPATLGRVARALGVDVQTIMEANEE